jgi:hypothetical protein
LENKKKELITWALEEFKNQLILSEQRWNFFSKQPFYDYRSSLTINQKVYEGRGIASSQTQAITACIAEALERYAIDFQNKKYPSNGCAVHLNKEQAIINSRAELIERHFVMLYSLGYANAETVDLDLIPQNLKYSLLELNEKNIEVKFYKLYEVNSDVVIICNISGLKSSPSFGLTFGSSCKRSLDDGIIASYLEALPNVMAYLNQNITTITLSDFKKIEQPKPTDHLSLYLDVEFATDYLSNVKRQSFENKNIDYSLFTSKEMHYPYSDILPAFRSIHPDCIEAQWGILPLNFNPENLNIDFPLVLP